MIAWALGKLAFLIGNAWMARISSVIDAILKIIAFVFKHWQVFLLLAILTLALLKYNAAVNAAAAAVKQKAIAEKALIDHVESDNAAAKARAAQNKLNSILAQKKTDADLAIHKAELTAIISKGKSSENISQRAISNHRDGLRLAIQREESAAAARLLENDANRSAIGNSNTTLPRSVQEAEAELEVCKEAGAIAAADYNLCNSYVKTQQSILGVQSE